MVLPSAFNSQAYVSKIAPHRTLRQTYSSVSTFQWPRLPRVACLREPRGRTGPTLAAGIYLWMKRFTCDVIRLICLNKSYSLPCIWPTVRARSRLSIPARSKSFGTLTSKNFWLRPWNHPSQYFSDLDKSIRQVYFLRLVEGIAGASESTEVGATGGGSSASSAIAFGLANVVRASRVSSAKGSSLVESFPVSMLKENS